MVARLVLFSLGKNRFEPFQLVLAYVVGRDVYVKREWETCIL